MAGKLENQKIAFLATDGVEAVELSVPWRAVLDEGATAHLLSVHDGEIQGLDHLDKGETFRVDRLVSEASADEYDGLVLPGGVANADDLRTHRDAVNFVREFMRQDKPVAVICHGPWMLVESGCVSGRVLTSWPSLQTDIRNAGGAWVDEEVHVDRNLVTSRKPEDLEMFCKRAVDAFAPTESASPRHGGVLALETHPEEETDRAMDDAVEQTFPASDPVPTPTKS